MQFWHSLLCVMCLFAATAGADDIRHQVAVVENPADDYVKICGWEFQPSGRGYSMCAIDLNGDSRTDHLFANAGTSGTGGWVATVYLAREDGKFTRIGTIGHSAVAVERRKDGAVVLHCSWNGGGGSASITTHLISHAGVEELAAFTGKWDDAKFRKRFEATFATALQLNYKQVPARR